MINKRIIINSLFAVFLFVSLSHAKVYLTKDDALKQTFPEGVSIERQTFFLSDEDIKKIHDISKAKVESKIFTYYIAKGRDNSILGYAMFESHIVRTKPEVFMLVINPEGRIERIEILAFYEPEEYLPPKKWLELFKGKYLNNQLWVKRDIHAITGATLTAEGITREVRKILAVFDVMVFKKESR